MANYVEVRSEISFLLELFATSDAGGEVHPQIWRGLAEFVLWLDGVPNNTCVCVWYFFIF
jgi:hypothetical protein